MRKSPGRSGFDLNYSNISKEYLSGAYLKDLAKKYDVSIWTLLDNFKKLGVKKKKIRYQDDNFFSKYTSESCYWAGFIAADGWISKYQLGIELSRVDKDHIRNFVKIINGNNKISNRKREKFHYSSVHINSKQMIDDLKKHFNIIPNKSLILEPPKQVPEKFISHYIRGYFDGDGSIGWHKHNQKMRLNICSGSVLFLEWLVGQITTNCKTGHPIINESNKLYTIEFMGKQVENILFWIYENSNNKIRLLRKHFKFTKYEGLLK
jgi:hypothetical protein